MFSLKDRMSTKCSLDLKINPDCIWVYKHYRMGGCVCVWSSSSVIWGVLVGFNMHSSSVFTINSLTSCSNSKTTPTHTNTVAKPDPKKVLVAITRWCNNYKLLSFIQEVQKEVLAVKMVPHYISCLHCKRKKQQEVPCTWILSVPPNMQEKGICNERNLFTVSQFIQFT